MSSSAVDDGTRLLLFDPLSLPPGLLALAADRQPVVVLTAPWHERDTRSLVERLVAPVFTPPPDTADDLVRKFGVTREQAGDGSLDLRWLRTGTGGAGFLYAAGDRLPVGVEAFAGREHNDLVLWDSRESGPLLCRWRVIANMWQRQGEDVRSLVPASERRRVVVESVRQLATP